jgi:hypothetical protein
MVRSPPPSTLEDALRPKRLAAAGLGLVLVLAAPSCGGKGAGGFSEESRRAYMEGCLEGDNQAFCDCTLAGFQSAFTEDEFEQIVLDFRFSEEPPVEFVDVIRTCLHDGGDG